MKNLYKIGLIILFLIGTLFLAIGADAAEISDLAPRVSMDYTVVETSTGYALYKSAKTGATPYFEADKLSKLIAKISEESNKSSVFFSRVRCEEVINLEEGVYTFFGELTLCGNSFITVNGASLSLSDAKISSENVAIRVKKGSLSVKDSSVSANSSAIVMDYFASSELTVESGDVSSFSAEALRLSAGSAKIKGGSIRSNAGAAILSSTTLTLVGEPSVVGVDYDIVASSPITLSEREEKYTGKCKLKYCSEFSKGEIAIVAYGATEASEERISLYDDLGHSVKVKYYDSFFSEDEKNFLTAYLPYEVKIINGEESEIQYKLFGETPDAPTVSEKPGYEFLGWRVGSRDGDFYEPGIPVSSDVVLYSSYNLIAPTFSFLSLSFVYDAEVHYLSLDEIFHPLLNEGAISYKWYKNGEELSFHGGEVALKNVSDSGKYKCLFTFSYRSDSVTVETPEVFVSVTKAEIALPSIPESEYNGELQYPDVSSISLYTVERVGAVNAGAYPIKIRLTDPENYSFIGSEESEITVDFIIKKANNFWMEEPSVRDFYLWQTPTVKATSKFGETKFSFSSSESGEFFEKIPSAVGTYFMKATVEETENYSGLIYPLIKVSVLEDTVEELYIITPAVKNSYVAFEPFDTSGLSVIAGYVSGREVEVFVSELSIDYRNAENKLLYGDRSVRISYGGVSVLHPVSVSLAEYDISSIAFEDFSFEYNATYQAPVFSEALPIGIDGIPLSCEIVGGGTAVGSYGISLVFSTQSQNYRTPAPIFAVMTIEPKKVDVIWENLNFIYDGAPKQPTAYYVDLNGRKVPLSVSGARSYAGSYEAKTVIADSNYVSDNTTATFHVGKADYDLSKIYWTAGTLTYNGTEQRVTLSGLPSGVSVIGYSDNRATVVGSYLANAILSYDTVNYNQPVVAPFSWSIAPAEYDESCMEFLDGDFVYDGEAHFPVFSGSLPVGLDGSRPTYSFSVGVTNVYEGSVAVKIDFATDSANYIAPESRVRLVRILPKEISVVWGETSFVYNSFLLSPTAYAEECEISVLGAKSNVGSYTAIAKALDSNYKVSNDECEYEITKAENFWKEAPFIEGIYESGRLSPCGKAAFGETRYIYSSDKETESALPLAAGIYYFMASSEGDENHYPIKSEWIEFEVIKVVPIGFYVTLVRTEFLTLEQLSSSDFTAYAILNDSATVEIPFSEISVGYENGERISYKDGRVKFSYLDFAAEKEISVIKRDYDLSGVIWEGVRGVYDGTEKYAALSGLPEGVKVDSYVGNGVKNAGVYIVKALLSYDSENYNEPLVADALITVEKQLVVPPDIKSVEYSGNTVFPKVAESDLYRWEASEEKDAGTYHVTYTVVDFSNYCFEGGAETTVKPYEIAARKLKVKISDVELYLFGKQSDPNFEIIEGELASGDFIHPAYQIADGVVSAIFDAKNYDIEIIDGTVLDFGRLSPEDIGKTVLILSLIFIFLIASTLVFLNRKKLHAYYIRTFSRGGREFIPSMPVLESECEAERGSEWEEKSEETSSESFDEEKRDAPENAQEREMGIRGAELSVIDASYADSAISDSLAKDLIRKDSVIATEGNKNRVINVDTLSRSFSSGDRVDINILKKKSLVPYDTGYIKVLARGIIDKPLTVYANDFSLSAVKMIALAGGKSVKVSSAPKIRIRGKGEFDKRS